MSQIFIKVINGEEAESWKQNRRKVLKNYYKGCQIDGIIDKRRYIYTWVAKVDPKYTITYGK